MINVVKSKFGIKVTGILGLISGPVIGRGKPLWMRNSLTNNHWKKEWVFICFRAVIVQIL